MTYSFLDIARTSSVKEAQGANGSGEFWERFRGNRQYDRFTPNETAFIAERDSFYIATVSETGWPYVQHRGGPPGFLQLLDDKTLAFPDFRGNRQYITVGNLRYDDKASLFLMDYPSRTRLKIFAHVEPKDLTANLRLASKLALPGYKAKIERAFLLHLDAFDWNCPQHITPRYTEPELESVIAPIRSRIKQLESENAELRQALAEKRDQL